MLQNDTIVQEEHVQDGTYSWHYPVSRPRRFFVEVGGSLLVFFFFRCFISFPTNGLTALLHFSAATYFEGYSPELIAPCLQEYAPGVGAALMLRWEPAFAASVRKNMELDDWTRIVDGNPDLELSVEWLRADTHLALAKQVVERIGQLDKSQGKGSARALQLMKGLRKGMSLTYYVSGSRSALQTASFS